MPWSQLLNTCSHSTRKDYATVSIDRIQKLVLQGRLKCSPENPITVKELHEAKVVDKVKDGVKVLGDVSRVANPLATYFDGEYRAGRRLTFLFTSHLLERHKASSKRSKDMAGVSYVSTTHHCRCVPSSKKGRHRVFLRLHVVQILVCTQPNYLCTLFN